jgi:hypothetical protein
VFSLVPVMVPVVVFPAKYGETDNGVCSIVVLVTRCVIWDVLVE